jgi:histidinol-phosphate aminotransferase
MSSRGAVPSTPEDGAGQPVPVRLRSALGAVPAYVPGKPPASRQGRTFKISSNENPYPPLPSVVDVIAAAAMSINRYPDMANAALVEAVAGALDVPPARVVPGTGSVGALIQLLQALVDEGDEVIFAWRSFEAYPIVVRLAGATPIAVPLTDDARHDLPAMAAAVTQRTRAIIVCTPNNPTGPAVRQAEFDAFVDSVPADVLVVIDEAYVEFVRDPDALDGLAAYRDHHNVALLRTFSKAYGLAGLRVGYAVAHESLAEGLRKTAVPFGVSGIGQAAAVASLAATDELLARVGELVDAREQVVKALTAQGWDLPETQANFVWVPAGSAVPDMVAACEAAGLAVRAFGSEGIRCTIGEPEANELLVDVLSRFAPGARSGR